MSRLSWLVGLAALSAVLAGCATTNTGADSGPQPSMAKESPMVPAPPMSSDAESGPGPSATARLVCGSEIRGDVAQILALTSLAPGTATWSGQLYTCTYRTPGGPVVLSVKDSTDLAVGQAYFDTLRRSLDPTQPLRGLDAFGLPAFETQGGTVVFLKDGKTLDVDTTHLSADAIPDHQSPADTAYAIAADVIGCWSE